MPRWGSGDNFLILRKDGAALASDGTIHTFLSAGLTPDLAALHGSLSGNSTTTFFPDAHALPYGHACRVEDGRVSADKIIRPLPANGDTRPEHILEVVFGAIRRIAPPSGDIAIALSGGVDSSLILAAAVAGGWRERLVGYIGDSPDGHDTHFAAVAARSAGIRYVKVPLPYHEPERDILSDLIALADSHGAPPPAGGISMVKIARRVAADGHGLLLHGMGGEMVSTGLCGKKWSPAFLSQLLNERRFIDAWKVASNPACRLSRRDFLVGLLTAKEHVDIAQHIVDSVSHGSIYEDSVRILRNTRAGGIASASPFLDEALEGFLLNDLEDRFFRTVIKLPARRALEMVIAPEVAWRKDDQGLRWDPKRFFAANREQVEPIFRYLPDFAPSAGAKVNADYLRRLSGAAFIAAVESCRARVKD